MIDLEATLTSGQVFRFGRTECGWRGVDGEVAMVLRQESFVNPEPHLVRFFRLDWDYERELGHLAKHPEMEPLVLASRGLRLLRPSCPREALFCFLCTANNHISRITQMVGRLAAVGEPIGDGMTRFPSLEAILEVGEGGLRAMGFGYRAKTIPKVATEILSWGGDDWFASMRARPYVEVIEELVSLPGVGPKLADCIALYAFDHTEAVPVDTHLWQAYCRTFRPEWGRQALTKTRYTAIGEDLRSRFGNRAALAQQILFYSNLRRGKFS